MVRIAGWSCLWIACFWAFLITGLPTDAAKRWLADTVAREFDATVSIGELRVAWNLDVSLHGVSVVRPAPDAGFAMRLESLRIVPRWPVLHFRGGTPSGGSLAGSYRSGEVTLSFSDVSFTDVTIATLPVPSRATMSGSGRLRLVTGHGTIDAEVDGVPGGKQRLKILGGAGPAVDGKVTITVRLPLTLSRW